MSKYKVTMHELNDLSHALALLESENASLRGAADGLCDENAMLREQLKYERQTSRSRLESIDLLKAENAKLRELVSDLYYETKSPSNHATQVEIRMNELGIEAS